MTDRENLIDLVHDYFKSVPWYADIADLNPEELIDHLLANGVRLESKKATSDENKRWIPVSERLPEEYNPVLAWYGEGYFAECARWTGRRWETTWEHEDFTGVTHWMPLPTPPEGGLHDDGT